MMTNAEKLIRKARLNIIHKYRYFASVALMPIVQADDIVETMGTDSKYLYFNSEAVDKWTYEEIYAVTLHEILHCIFMHIHRVKNRNRLYFQYAADYAINSFIKNYMYIRLPEPHLYNDDYVDMSTEEIYNKLVEPFCLSQSQSQSPSGHQGGTDLHNTQTLNPNVGDIDFDSLQDLVSTTPPTDDYDNDPQQFENVKTSTSIAKELEKTVILRGQLVYPEDISLKQQALYTKNIENALRNTDTPLTQELKKIIDKHVQVERIAWFHVLQNYVRDLAPGDYGFHIPNVRYVYSGFYLPAFRVKRITKLSLVIDISGSITSRYDMLSNFFEHIRNIAEDCIIDNIEILTCNTKIVDKFSITSHELMFHNFEIEGGGGTNLYPPLDYYDDTDNVQPDLMIYFTDLDGEFRKEPPNFPIVWVVIEHPNRPETFLSAPYGTEIRYIP